MVNSFVSRAKLVPGGIRLFRSRMEPESILFRYCNGQSDQAPWHTTAVDSSTPTYGMNWKLVSIVPVGTPVTS